MPLVDGVPVAEGVGEPLVVPEGVCETLAEPEPLGDPVPLRVSDGVSEAVWLGVDVALGVCEGVGEHSTFTATSAMPRTSAPADQGPLLLAAEKAPRDVPVPSAGGAPLPTAYHRVATAAENASEKFAAAVAESASAGGRLTVT